MWMLSGVTTTHRATKGFSARIQATFRRLIRRNPTMPLRYCIPKGLWIIHVRVIREMSLKSSVWLPTDWKPSNLAFLGKLPPNPLRFIPRDSPSGPPPPPIHSNRRVLSAPRVRAQAQSPTENRSSPHYIRVSHYIGVPHRPITRIDRSAPAMS